jgi:hypothetical protein
MFGCTELVLWWTTYQPNIQLHLSYEIPVTYRYGILSSIVTTILEKPQENCPLRVQ